MIATQVIDAHFHSMDARVETFGAFVHICDKNKERRFAHDKKCPQPVNKTIGQDITRKNTGKQFKTQAKIDFPLMNKNWLQQE